MDARLSLFTVLLALTGFSNPTEVTPSAAASRRAEPKSPREDDKTSPRPDPTEEAAVKALEKHSRKRVKRSEGQPGKPVVGIDLSFSDVSDTELKEVAALKNLRTLDLRFTKVTNDGLKELAPLKNLGTLTAR